MKLASDERMSDDGLYSSISATLHIIRPKMPSMEKVEFDRIDTHSIKKLLAEIGSPIIPLTLVFEALGFNGVTGLDWGILAGAISALAIELGYKVERVGRFIVLVQWKKNLAKGKGGWKPLEIGDQRW